MISHPQGSMDGLPAGGGHFDVNASGHGRNFVLGNGTMIVHGGMAASGTTAIVTRVVGHDDVATAQVFCGRDREVAGLLESLDPAGSGPGVTVASAVAGLAGVGKTTLIRRVAAAAEGRGWFPGGVLFTDLQGYDSDPQTRVTGGQVYAPLLRALGVDGERIPSTVGEQATDYHQRLVRLAEQGRPVLLVLDNASTTDQVAGLLPTHRAHRVLVTSRHTLGDLPGVRILDLDVLPDAQAINLLDEVLRQRDSTDHRMAREQAGATELVRLCGGLPLALQIAAALLADDRSLPLADMAAELSDAGTRLAGLAYGARAVSAAFELSWRQLTDRDMQESRLLLLLPVNPGPDLSVEAAAVLINRAPLVVRRQLRLLRRAHLIEPGTAAGRWRLHDLMRLYVEQLAAIHTSPDERAAAADRLLDHYLTTARAADDHLQVSRRQSAPARFTGRDQALTWLETERPNLLAAVTLAANTGRYGIAVDLSLHLAEFLGRRRHFNERVETATTALRAAGHLPDRQCQAAALNDLGVALQQVRRFAEAITAHEQAAAIFAVTGDAHRESAALNNLVVARSRLIGDLLSRYSDLRQRAARQPQGDEELAVYEQRLLCYVRDSSDRGPTGPGYQALGGLLTNELDELVEFIAVRVGEHDAEDYAHDTIATILSNYSATGLALEDGRAALHAYIYSTALDVLRQHYQPQHERPERLTEPHELSEISEDTAVSDGLAAVVVSPEKQVLDQAHLEYLTERVLLGMTAAERIVFQTHLETGLEDEALAAALTERNGKPVSAAAATASLSQARTVVRTKLVSLRLALRGRACRDLDALLAGWQTPPLPDMLVAKVSVHYKTCLTCQAFTVRWPPTFTEHTMLLNNIASVSGITLAKPALDRAPEWLHGPAATGPRPATPAALPPPPSAAAPPSTAPGQHGRITAAARTLGRHSRRIVPLGTALAGTAAAVYLGILNQHPAPDSVGRPYATPLAPAQADPSGPSSAATRPPASVKSGTSAPLGPSPVGPRSVVPTGGNANSPSVRATVTPHYAGPPNLTGNWELDFKRTNFGGAMENHVQVYTIALRRLPDSTCSYAPPCYGAPRWTNVTAGHDETSHFNATDLLSANLLRLSATDADEYGTQYYDGTAPDNGSPLPRFTGNFHENTPDGVRTATFVFFRTS
jgi:hypothetical protein